MRAKTRTCPGSPRQGSERPSLRDLRSAGWGWSALASLCQAMALTVPASSPDEHAERHPTPSRQLVVSHAATRRARPTVRRAADDQSAVGSVSSITRATAHADASGRLVTTSSTLLQARPCRQRHDGHSGPASPSHRASSRSTLTWVADRIHRVRADSRFMLSNRLNCAILRRSDYSDSNLSSARGGSDANFYRDPRGLQESLG